MLLTILKAIALMILYFILLYGIVVSTKSIFEDWNNLKIIIIINIGKYGNKSMQSMRKRITFIRI